MSQYNLAILVYMSTITNFGEMLMKHRSTWLGLAVALIATAAPGARAQGSFPEKPIRLIVPVAAGGGIDSAFRVIAPQWSALLGQPVVIENKPGAGQAIGIDLVVKSAPDGYTLAGVGVPIAFNTALGRKLPYDPLKDLTPVGEVVTQPLLVAANSSVPAKSINELFEWMRSQPIPVPYATGGPGSYGHLWWEMVSSQRKLRTEQIAYQGAAPALRDVIAGQVPLLIDAIVPTGVQVKAGKLKGLGVVRTERSPVLADVATLTEQGFPMYEGAPFYGVVGPAGMKPAVLAKLNDTLVRALRTSATQTKLAEMGFDVVASTPEAYGKKIGDEIERWSRIVRENNIKVE